MKPPVVPQPSEAFGRLKAQVIARTGHFYYEDKEDLLWERVRKRLRGRTVEAYLERLEDPDGGEAEWTALEAELTIGETYFFRYPEQFDALRSTIFPHIFEHAAESRRLRIWSAGCATGAEAYSVAILLHEMLGDAISQWRISILGTDINDNFLAAAREARFGAWALRSLTAEQRSAWFAADAGQWRLKPQYRGLVRFQRGNLLDLLGPSPPLELADFDLILCRNVLIYFHPAKIANIAGALVARLKPEGWLLVGHAEPNPDFRRVAASTSLPGTVAYRPRGAVLEQGGDAPVREAWTSPPADPAPPRPEAWRPLPPPAAPTPPPAAPAPADRLVSEDVVGEVRRRADVGDFAGARMKCREGLDARPDDPILQFYAGLVEQALGHLSAAEEALRRASYLDPRFVLALYHLGLVRLARGRTESGRRAVASAARLAGTLAVDERLPEGAGLTAGELRELARVQLEAGAGA